MLIVRNKIYFNCQMNEDLNGQIFQQKPTTSQYALTKYKRQILELEHSLGKGTKPSGYTHTKPKARLNNQIMKSSKIAPLNQAASTNYTPQQEPVNLSHQSSRDVCFTSVLTPNQFEDPFANNSIVYQDQNSSLSRLSSQTFFSRASVKPSKHHLQYSTKQSRNYRGIHKSASKPKQPRAVRQSKDRSVYINTPSKNPYSTHSSLGFTTTKGKSKGLRAKSKGASPLRDIGRNLSYMPKKKYKWDSADPMGEQVSIQKQGKQSGKSTRSDNLLEFIQQKKIPGSAKKISSGRKSNLIAEQPYESLRLPNQTNEPQPQESHKISRNRYSNWSFGEVNQPVASTPSLCQEGFKTTSGFNCDLKPQNKIPIRPSSRECPNIEVRQRIIPSQTSSQSVKNTRKQSRKALGEYQSRNKGKQISQSQIKSQHSDKSRSPIRHDQTERGADKTNYYTYGLDDDNEDLCSLLEQNLSSFNLDLQNRVLFGPKYSAEKEPDISKSLRILSNLHKSSEESREQHEQYLESIMYMDKIKKEVDLNYDMFFDVKVSANCRVGSELNSQQTTIRELTKNDVQPAFTLQDLQTSEPVKSKKSVQEVTEGVLEAKSEANQSQSIKQELNKSKESEVVRVIRSAGSMSGSSISDTENEEYPLNIQDQRQDPMEKSEEIFLTRPNQIQVPQLQQQKTEPGGPPTISNLQKESMYFQGKCLQCEQRESMPVPKDAQLQGSLLQLEDMIKSHIEISQVAKNGGGIFFDPEDLESDMILLTKIQRQCLRSISSGGDTKYTVQMLERVWKIIIAQVDKAIISNLQHEKSIKDKAFKMFQKYQNMMEKEYLVLQNKWQKSEEIYQDNLGRLKQSLNRCIEDKLKMDDLVKDRDMFIKEIKSGGGIKKIKHLIKALENCLDSTAKEKKSQMDMVAMINKTLKDPNLIKQFKDRSLEKFKGRQGKIKIRRKKKKPNQHASPEAQDQKARIILQQQRAPGQIVIGQKGAPLGADGKPLGIDSKTPMDSLQTETLLGSQDGSLKRGFSQMDGEVNMSDGDEDGEGEGSSSGEEGCEGTEKGETDFDLEDMYESQPNEFNPNMSDCAVQTGVSSFRIPWNQVLKTKSFEELQGILDNFISQYVSGSSRGRSILGDESKTSARSGKSARSGVSGNRSRRGHLKIPENPFLSTLRKSKLSKRDKNHKMAETTMYKLVEAAMDEQIKAEVEQGKILDFKCFIYDYMLRQYGFKQLSIKHMEHLKNGLMDCYKKKKYAKLITDLIGLKEGTELTRDKARVFCKARWVFNEAVSQAKQRGGIEMKNKSEKKDSILYMQNGGEILIFDLISYLEKAFDNQDLYNHIIPDIRPDFLIDQKENSTDEQIQQFCIMKICAKIKAMGKDLKYVFDTIDYNQNDKLSHEEFQTALMTKFSMPFSDYEFTLIMKELDQDKSGFVDFDEFSSKINLNIYYEKAHQYKISKATFISIILNSFDSFARIHKNMLMGQLSKFIDKKSEVVTRSVFDKVLLSLDSHLNAQSLDEMYRDSLSIYYRSLDNINMEEDAPVLGMFETVMNRKVGGIGGEYFGNHIKKKISQMMLVKKQPTQK